MRVDRSAPAASAKKDRDADLRSTDEVADSRLGEAAPHSGQLFGKAAPVQWFAEHYPKIKGNAVEMHVEGMSTNNKTRKHHPSIRPTQGFDLLYKLGPGQSRLYDPQTDSPPFYKTTIEAAEARNCGASRREAALSPRCPVARRPKRT